MRLIPRIETWPWCLRIAQTVPGRLGILLLFALGLSIRRDHAFALVFVAGVVAFVPKRRWLMLLIGTLGWTFTYLWPTLDWAAVRAVARQAGIVLDLETLAPISVVLALLCGTLVVSLAFRFRRSAFFRRPILALLVGYFAGLAVLSYAPMPGQIRLQGWAFMSAFGAYLWFVCYALTDRNSRDLHERDRVRSHLPAHQPRPGRDPHPQFLFRRHAVGSRPRPGRLHGVGAQLPAQARLTVERGVSGPEHRRRTRDLNPNPPATCPVPTS